MRRFIKRNAVWVLAIVLSITACKSNKTPDANIKLPLPTVTVGKPVMKNKIVYTEFRAVSQYLQKVNFRARTAGIITAVFIRPGDGIKNHQALFVVKPMELSALQNTGSLTSSLINSFDTIYSDQSAFTNQVMVQEGDYVQPGGLLGTAFKKTSLAAIVYVPFAQIPLIKKNSPCTIEIPGRGNVKSFFKNQLYLADNITQTQPFVVPLSPDLHLPEDMNLLASLEVKEIKNGIFVPKAAVLANEEENSFWLMKMTNDTTAVKVPVKIGLRGNQYIEILSNNIGISDRVITQGAYGLPDTAYVRIVK